MQTPSQPPPAPQARATIVMSFRERWSLTLQSLQAVVEHTRMPHALLLLDTGMPDSLRHALQSRCAAWKLRIVQFKHQGLWPQQARQIVARHIETPYTAFIDNDVLVEPGWLEKMIDCADATGAGIVGPLYLWGADGRSDLIHMAGGEITLTQHEGTSVLEERHRHINTPLADIAPPLQRQPCDFAEYHCLLMRKEVLHAPDTFESGIASVHEHIHASLVAKELGLQTWLEPDARVCYLAQAPWQLGELDGLRKRWDRTVAEHSLQRFAARWHVTDETRSFAGVRGFVRAHVANTDPLRATLRNPARAASSMDESQLRQTPSSLARQAQQAGYSETDLQRIARAYRAALVLANGGYRPCGRPFINHLVGTASVLVHYGLETRLIEAALLHTAYTHSLPRDPQHRHATLQRIAACLGAPGSALERSVRHYTLRQPRLQHLLDTRTTVDALRLDDLETLLLDAANEIDMLLSGEVAASGRRDLAAPELVQLIVLACARLGISGLGRTLVAARNVLQETAAPTLVRAPAYGSFRLIEGSAVPMAHAPALPQHAGQPALAATTLPDA